MRRPCLLRLVSWLALSFVLTPARDQSTIDTAVTLQFATTRPTRSHRERLRKPLQ